MKPADTLTEGQRFDLMRSRMWKAIIPSCIVCPVVGVVLANVTRAVDAQWRLPLLVGTAALVVVIIVALTLWLMRDVIGMPPFSEGFIVSRVDAIQRHRSLGLLVFTPLALLVTPFIWLAAGEIVDGTAKLSAYMHLVLWLCLSLFHLSNMLGLFKGKRFNAVYNDEFSRHLRSRAMLIGFWFLFCGGIAVFVIGIGEPARSVQAVPALLLLTVIAATLSFAVMDLRAGRER